MNRQSLTWKSWRSASVALFMVMLSLAATVSWGKVAMPLAADPALELRMMTLAAELRCLVCQNQSLAESNAELAVDLRQLMRQQMRQGASDQDIIDYMVARYGDFVLYRPPLKASTVLLWSGPVMLLLLGLGLQWRTIRRQRTNQAAPDSRGGEPVNAKETA